jgi:CheY-like chemotaxis protein
MPPLNATSSPSVAPESMARPRVEGELAPILVVDDSVLSRRLAAGLIEEGTGRPVIFAGDGASALERIEVSSPCMVLTDLHMPIMDGFELVEAIRKEHPQTPVVLMTAFGSESVAVRALKAGATSYVPKDRLVTDLVETVRQILLVVEGNQRRRRLLSCQVARTCSFEIGNEPDLLPTLIGLIQEDLIAFAIGDDTTRLQVAVALQEALSNALYHGNLECSSDLRQEDERIFYRQADDRRSMEPYRSRLIRVKLEIDHEHARITIRDEGRGFDVSILNKPFNPEDLLKVGGRGMILIRTFLDEVVHNGRGNEITLVKRR